MQPLLDEIALAVKRIYREAVDPLSDKYAFEKRPDEGEIAGAPTVLFLGNHSSGTRSSSQYQTAIRRTPSRLDRPHRGYHTSGKVFTAAT